MAQKSFGTGGTITKLNTIADYLQFYTTALGGKFRLTYIDGFAGSGEIPIKSELPLFDGVIEYEKVIPGSARNSLSLDRPFDSYVFADTKKSNVTSLSLLSKEFPHLADRIRVVRGDANGVVLDYCTAHNPKTDRAVIFLDPFGNHVNWSTVEAVARCKGIDLWYLFPSGLGVVRQISDDASVQKDAEESLNRIFGDNSWIEASTVHTGQLNLLEVESEDRRKTATADSITRHFISKMRNVFEGVVLDEWLALGAKNGHWYSLVFACSNDSEKAKSLARRVAKDIMKKK